LKFIDGHRTSHLWHGFVAQFPFVIGKPFMRWSRDDIKWRHAARPIPRNDGPHPTPRTGGPGSQTLQLKQRMGFTQPERKHG